MADKVPAGPGAQDQGEEQPQNPFAGFSSEAFHAGERIEEKEEQQEPAKPPVEKPKAVESPDDADDLDDADDADDPDDAPRGEKPKETPSQKRIRELTRKRHDERRRAEAAERELERLRAEMKRGSEPPDNGDREAAREQRKTAAGADKTAPPNADDAEKYPYGELDPKYIRDLSRYEAEQRFKELVQESQETRAREQALEHQREMQQKFEDQIKIGEEKYDDFYEKVVEGAENDEWLLSREMAELLVESPAGADIAYHLASHPEEAAQVYRQSPLEQARYFGKLEAKFSAEAAAAGSKPEEPEKPKLPQAPPPPERPRGRTGRYSVSPDTQDFAAFEKMAMGRNQ